MIPREYQFKDRIIRPVISVFDHDAKIPLSLNRNFFTSRLPFEEHITKDIYRSIIYNLLKFKIESIVKNEFLTTNSIYKFFYPAFESGNRENVESVNKIVCLNNGFILNHPSYLHKFKGCKIIDSIQIDYDRNPNTVKEFTFPLMPNHLIRFTNIHLSRSSRDFADYLSQTFGHMNLIRNSIMKSNIANEFKFYNSESEITQLNKEKYGEIFRTLNRDILLINNIVNKVENDLLSEVIDEYLGDDPIIPYDMKEREKKFPKAFKELKKYDMNLKH